ncbi:helix-turn-helix domain-containing protein [Mesonia aestuariivivens]|uniref:AraC family transcriptional regulator n=1 Tax=Mesonia aestuariivivens TaxID=2796128 RepID=A0ABS6W5J1_9FLAO|nr:AraC family transcriptional regulator [Mesonia aestuariivivens]MBW2962384.1 AraC family transcriptional regulator [Mesonia aestuariivivens]
MKNLYVKSLPLKEVISDLAQEFNCEIIEHCDEFVLEIPKEKGEGFIRAINFGKGLGVIEYNCIFFDDLQIHFSISQIHPLKFIFCSKGSIKHCFEELGEESSIDCYQNVLVASSAFNGHILHFEKNKKVHINSLEINRKEFKKHYLCSLSKFEHPLKALFCDVEATKLFYYQGNYSLQTADIIKEINTDLFSDFLRALKLESKALDILAVQVEQYADDLKLNKNQSVIRKNEIEKIIHLTEKISSELYTPYTVQQLADSIGININKLQEGFKYLYNDTVNNYIQALRLEKAKDYLLETDFSIAEITDKIGLTNPSYFSKVFKEKYKITPNQYRRSKTKTNQILDS